MSDASRYAGYLSSIKKQEQTERREVEHRERYLIVDGLNAFIRNWTVVPTMDANGNHVGGVVGFLRTVKCLIRENCPSRVLIIWDGHGGSARRRKLYSEYKAGRKPRVNREYDFETPEKMFQSLHAQYEKTKQYVEMLGMTQVEIESIEADDVIALLCLHMLPQDSDKVVVTSDKDMFQLVGPRTLVYSPTKKMYYTGPAVKERFGVLPENFVYMKALMGDGSDNIPGIKGIGEKTVVKLFPFLADHPSTLSEIVDHAAANQGVGNKYREVIACKDVLVRNVQLMQLSSPIISAQSVQAVKYAVQRELRHRAGPEVKMAFLQDGIQITDSDFFSTFREYHLRAGTPAVKETDG